MFFCIPSYQRAHLLPHRTLAFLKRHGVEQKSIYIFVVKDDLEAYEAACPDYNIVVGVRGLVNQRKFIYNYMGAGSHIMFCDDDVQDVLGMDKKPVKNLVALCEMAFQMCELEGLRMWGFNSVCNPFFMKNTVTTHLLFCVGAMFGLIQKGEILNPKQDFKEDIWRTCAYYQADGGVLRLNFASVKTTYCKGKGGLNGSRTLDKEIAGVEAVCSAFPLYAKAWVRKNGRVEVRLRHSKKLTA